MLPPRYYDRLSATTSTRGGNLPHWSQACATFVTFRLNDSLPAEKLSLYESELKEFMATHPEPWDESTQMEYYERFPRRLQSWLDAGYGACLLADPALRVIVEESLRHFADVRYSLYAFVVMPNHVHVLFMPHEGVDGREVVATWKRYTARAINAARGARGEVWQKESYDHLVRNVGQFNACRSYIKNNNRKLAFDAYDENEEL